MFQPRKMLILSLTLQNGTLISLLFLLYLQLVLVCTKIHCFAKYTPKKRFNSCVQSAVDARRQTNENTNSAVTAETLKLLANSSHSCWIMNFKQHSVAKNLNDEETHAAINSKLFKKLNHVNNALLS